MTMLAKPPKAPSDDKRWRIVDATMRRHGYSGNGLIESLHSVQQAFGYIDEPSIRYVSAALRVPVAKTFGVATFYHFFQLKPQGKHACVVCLGTACYIKGSKALLDTIEENYHIKEGETTVDGELSVLVARCIGACGLAPATVLDGEVIAKPTPEQLVARIKTKLGKAVPA